MSIENTYWNNNGKYENLQKELNATINSILKVEDTLPKNTHRALEKYRRACFCYYDLYNNGLYNMQSEFRKVFGFSARKFKYSWRTNNVPPSMIDAVEDKFNELLLKACMEQKIFIR